MQLQGRTRLSPLLALAVQLSLGCAAKVHTFLHQRLAASAASGAWAALAEVEVEDQRFWSEQWGALEATLLRLEGATDGLTARGAALLQAANASGAPRLAGAEKRASPPAGAKLNLSPKSAADLAPALAMLKAMYEDGKERIAQLNAREAQSKQRFEGQQKQHEARLATVEGRFKNGTLSAEFRKNETRDESRIWTYWQRVRERQHSQFHTSLKIQHGTMAKVKTMIGVYEKAMGGKASKAEVQKDLARVTGVMPEVVLLQQAWRASAPFFRDALAEVRSASAELARGSSLP